MAGTTVDRPIFIVGSGRCGSTLFHQALSYHPQVAFLTEACARHPASAWQNRMIMRLLDAPLVGRYLRRRFPANEHWAFWNWHCRGFSRPCRDLLADDVRPNEAAHIQAVLAGIPAGRRRRLAIKFTGWPRIGFLAGVFPDAKFIHLLRDGRAVVNSLLNVDFWQGWVGPESWGWGKLTGAEEEEWRISGKSFVVLAAIQWKRHMDAFEIAKTRLTPEQCLELKYENFARAPVSEMERVLEFCELEADGNFNAKIAALAVDNRNSKWRDQLTRPQQVLLEDSLRDHLRRYQYELDGEQPTPLDPPRCPAYGHRA
jgi:hypothetical protein